VGSVEIIGQEQQAAYSSGHEAVTQKLCKEGWCHNGIEEYEQQENRNPGQQDNNHPLVVEIP
jgi:hypothetical protein